MIIINLAANPGPTADKPSAVVTQVCNHLPEPNSLIVMPTTGRLDVQESLSDAERNRLQTCESVLEKGLSGVFNVGNALLTIRESRLYRETHPSFEAYCHERWGIGRSYASRMIGAAERIKLLPEKSDVPRPATEFQVRPFLKLQPAAFPKIWNEIAKRAGNGKINPQLIRETIKKFSARSDRHLSKRRRHRNTGSKAWIGQLLALLHDAKNRIERGDGVEALPVLEQVENVLVNH